MKINVCKENHSDFLIKSLKHLHKLSLIYISLQVFRRLFYFLSYLFSWDWAAGSSRQAISQVCHLQGNYKLFKDTLCQYRLADNYLSLVPLNVANTSAVWTSPACLLACLLGHHRRDAFTWDSTTHYCMTFSSMRNYRIFLYLIQPQGYVSLALCKYSLNK